MTRESLNISGKLDTASLQVIEVISEEANRLSIPFLIVGAAARDMLMHHYYGVAIQRATADVDFAVDVADWQSYQSLTASRTNRGFQKTNQKQRLKADNDMLVDIVPVVSVPGFLLLKLIAWGDRVADQRPKDAIDTKFIIQKYATIAPSIDSVWTQPDLIDLHDGDIERVAAQLLGRLVSDLASNESNQAVKRLLSTKTLDTFCTEMSPRGRDKFDENRALMDAFTQGFDPK